MKNKISHFLTVSLISLFILCVLVFSFLAVFMNKETKKTVDEVGTLYMSGMNERIYQHFDTMLDIYFDQINVLKNSIPIDADDQEIRDTLREKVNLQVFDSLAIYYSDESFDMIYGDSIESLDPEPFISSLKNGEEKISAGVNANGDKVILMGVPFNGIMGKSDCVALVVQLPIEYISDALSLDYEDSLVYSYVIRRDGSFVIRSSDAFRENYFDRVKNRYSNSGDKTPEQYIEELQKAMSSDENYSSEVVVDGKQYHIFCSTLPKSEWYLITAMPYGTLNESVAKLSSEDLLFALSTNACF